MSTVADSVQNADSMYIPRWNIPKMAPATPTKLPTMLPSPPTITMTKQSTVMMASIPGGGAVEGAESASPIPASAEPRMKTPV